MDTPVNQRKGSRFVSPNILNGINDSPRVLIIDDCPDVIEPLKIAFKKVGCLPESALNCHQALDHLLNQKYDLIILDWFLPDSTGEKTISMADQILRDNPNQFFNFKPVPVVVFTSTNTRKIKAPITQYFHIKGIWRKPIPYHLLRTCIEETLIYLSQEGDSTLAA